jgi:polyferredoxin
LSGNCATTGKTARRSPRIEKHRRISGSGDTSACAAEIDIAGRARAMKKRDVKREELRPIYRLGFILIGLMFIAMGALPLLRGKTHYETYWGGAVFGPFAIFVGLLLPVAVFTQRRKWK